MLERLRMQEVSEIVLTVPEGAVIAGTNLTVGEPIMIIKDPSLSILEFKSTAHANNDAKGFISASGLTSQLDFTINEGSILYSVWSYIHGTLEQKGTSTLTGTEWISPDKIMGTDFYLSTESEPRNVTLYELVDGVLVKKTRGQDYDIYVDENRFLIRLAYQPQFNNFFAVYSYSMSDVSVTKVKQIHNNVFGALDIYFKAVDIETEDEHTVCVHCDKVQIFMDLAISVNNSQKASFTPIRITSIPESSDKGINKDVATITVV
jgi:hypothetical protein